MTVDSPSEMPIVQEPISRALHNLTDLGIVTTDVELRITGWNRWMEIHTGKATADVLGRKLTELYPELVERRHHQHYQQALQGRVVILAQRFHRYLLPMPHSVGVSATPLMQQSARIAPLIDEAKTVGTLTIIEDVSDRVNYDNQLAKHASRQLAISTLSQTALRGLSLDEIYSEACRLTAATLDVSLTAIVECAPNSQQIRLREGYGWDPNSLLSELAASLPPFATAAFADSRRVIPISADDASQLVKLREQTVAGGICVALPGTEPPTGLFAVFSKIPREFTEEDTDFLRTMSGIVGMAQNRHRLLHQLQTKIDDLAIADQRKDEFLAMLAHELRNPLAPITNATELLRNNILDDTTRNWATAVIERQLLQITRLVDDLLDVARITRGKVVLRKSIVDISTVVARALETSQPIVESRRHSLLVSLPRDPLLIECDVARLSQVIANLLNNAAKYTDNGGTIRLNVERQREEVEIAIIDSGVGIPENMLPSIFDLFTQVNPSLDRKEGGLGIGLTLVKSLVTLHGGTVSVRSEGIGKGSEFRVRLPLPELSRAAEQPDLSESTAAIPPKRVLIVDDNEDAADLLKLLLHNFGHDVRCVYDGKTALTCADQAHPDVVVLDLGLPGMTGYEVAATLRKRHGQNIVLVALTGYGQDDDRRRTAEAGFDYHLVKPIAASELDALFGQFNR